MKKLIPIKSTITICIIVCCICLIILVGLLNKPKIINQEEIIYDSFQQLYTEAQIVEIPTLVEPYKVVLDEKMIYYLGGSLEDDSSFDVDGIALYGLSCEEKTREISILEVKQSKRLSCFHGRRAEPNRSASAGKSEEYREDYDGRNFFARCAR